MTSEHKNPLVGGGGKNDIVGVGWNKVTNSRMKPTTKHGQEA